MRKLLLLTLMLFATLYAKSQTISGVTKSCPNSVFAYGLQNYDNNKQYKWKITNGKRSTDNATEFCGMNASIRWDSDLAQNGKIEIYLVADCNPGTTGPLVASLNVNAFNFIAGSTMPSANGTCATTPTYPKLTCGSPQTIDVWFMLPLHGNTDYNDVSSYDFIANTNHVSLPTGWSVIAGSLTTSDYVCDQLGGAKYKRIMARVKTDGIHDGEVKVRVSGNCNSTTVPYYGSWSSAEHFSFAAPSASISGPYELCTTATYNIPDLPTGATVSWSATGSIAISGASNGSSVTVTKTSNGEGNITATLTTVCSSGSISKQVFAGTSNAPTGININGVTYNSGSSFCLPRRSQYLVTVNPVAGATSYQWSVYPASSATIGYGQGEDAIWITVNGAAGAPIYINVRPQNDCGLGWEFAAAGQVCSAGGGFLSFTVSPNPSSNELRITKQTEEAVADRTKEAVLQNEFNVKLFNEKGKILKTGRTSAGKEIVLKVADLPNGIYYLHIYEGKKVTKQQVVIAH